MGVAPDTLMVNSLLRTVVAVFALAVTVISASPVPDVDDTSAHDGTPVRLHDPFVVMDSVLASPSAVKLIEDTDALNVGVGFSSFLLQPTINAMAINTAILQITVIFVRFISANFIVIIIENSACKDILLNCACQSYKYMIFHFVDKSYAIKGLRLLSFRICNPE